MMMMMMIYDVFTVLLLLLLLNYYTSLNLPSYDDASVEKVQFELTLMKYLRKTTRNYVKKQLERTGFGIVSGPTDRV